MITSHHRLAEGKDFLNPSSPLSFWSCSRGPSFIKYLHGRQSMGYPRHKNSKQVLHLIRKGKKTMEVQTQKSLSIPCTGLLPIETNPLVCTHLMQVQFTSPRTSVSQESSQLSQWDCTCVRQGLQCPHFNKWEISIFLPVLAFNMSYHISLTFLLGNIV